MLLKLFRLTAFLLLFGCWSKETEGCTAGTLRLDNGNDGRLELCIDNVWIGVCSGSNDEIISSIACRQLGFVSATSSDRDSSSPNGVIMHSLNCTGSEYTLLQCTQSLSLTDACPKLMLRCSGDDMRVCTNGGVQLTNENIVNDNKGVVSLCVSNHWATLYDDNWTDNEAKIICRMLNFQSGVVGADYESGSGAFGDGDSVKCDGSEVSIFQCSLDLDFAFNNSLAESASVTCQVGGGFENGAVRLYRNGVHSSLYTHGIVQLRYRDITGNICDDFNFGSNEANIICHQLGYTGASSYSRAGLMNYGTDSNPTVLDDVHCPNTDYLTILQCSYSTVIDRICSSHSNDATVNCYSTRIWDSNPFPGMIRLQGGTYSNEGLVEVYCREGWGTICSTGFDSNAAGTVCRQLGYTNHVSYNHLKISSNSSRVIWFSNVTSTSQAVDNCIISVNGCPSRSVTDCNGANDATVECTTLEAAGRVDNRIQTCAMQTPTTDPTVATSTTATDLPFYQSRLFLYGASAIGGILAILLLIFICCCCCQCYCRRRRKRPFNPRMSFPSQHVTLNSMPLSGMANECIVHNPLADLPDDDTVIAASNDAYNQLAPSTGPSSPPAPPTPPAPPPPPPTPPVNSSLTHRSSSSPAHLSSVASPPPSAPPPPPIAAAITQRSNSILNPTVVPSAPVSIIASPPPSAPPPPVAPKNIVTKTFPRKVSAPPSLSPIPSIRHPISSTLPPSSHITNTASANQQFQTLPSRRPSNPPQIPSAPQPTASVLSPPPPPPPPPPLPPPAPVAPNSATRRHSQPVIARGAVMPDQSGNYSSSQPDSRPQFQLPPNQAGSSQPAMLSYEYKKRTSFGSK